MSEKIVSLTVHKNTLEKRHGKEVRQDALRNLKAMLTDNVPAAFALIVIDKDQNTSSYMYEGKLRPAEFALLVRDALRGDLLAEALTMADEELET